MLSGITVIRVTYCQGYPLQKLLTIRDTRYKSYLLLEIPLQELLSGIYRLHVLLTIRDARYRYYLLSEIPATGVSYYQRYPLHALLSEVLVIGVNYNQRSPLQELLIIRDTRYRSYYQTA